jgi:uncharacterized membrane protein
MKKKKFKDTKVGAFLLKKAPKFVSSMLPSGGVLDVIKSLIDSDSNITIEQKEQMHKELIELYSLEVQDRDSARKREVEVRKQGIDWMFIFTGIIGLASFSYLVYTIINVEVPEANKELFIHLIGIVEGVALSIFSYYFGQSIIKDK